MAAFTEDDETSESPLIKSFKKYSEVMKASQDKYERLFKLRRDITIESKRVIFLLHSIDKESKKTAVCVEAEQRLNNLLSKEYRKIADELNGEDPYSYIRAVSPGNQEFCEALTFLEYLQGGKLRGIISCKEIPFIPTLDYVMGVADLTGELMRRCVSSLGTGDFIEVNNIVPFLREVYIGMLGVSSGREMNGKLHTLESSLLKVERIAYSLHILGNEIPESGIFFMDSNHEIEQRFQLSVM